LGDPREGTHEIDSVAINTTRRVAEGKPVTVEGFAVNRVEIFGRREGSAESILAALASAASGCVSRAKRAV
jgi:hypothetical protein